MSPALAAIVLLALATGAPAAAASPYHCHASPPPPWPVLVCATAYGYGGYGDCNTGQTAEVALVTAGDDLAVSADNGCSTFAGGYSWLIVRTPAGDVQWVDSTWGCSMVLGAHHLGCVLGPPPVVRVLP